MLEIDHPALSKPRSSRRRLQPPQSDPLKCPRCESTNTKFCYYNNHNKTQPRHFCKACKRHWTKGGILRNVPVGGGPKNKHVKRSRPNIVFDTGASTIGPMVVKKNLNQDHEVLLLGLNDPKDKSCDTLNPKASIFNGTDDERNDGMESYTDIEELKGLVSWDLHESFSGLTMQQWPHQDHQILGFSRSLSTFELNPSLDTQRLFMEKIENMEDSAIVPSYQQWQVPSTSPFLEPNSWNWIDLDTLVLADIKKPWEDPQFTT